MRKAKEYRFQDSLPTATSANSRDGIELAKYDAQVKENSARVRDEVVREHMIRIGLWSADRENAA